MTPKATSALVFERLNTARRARGVRSPHGMVRCASPEIQLKCSKCDANYHGKSECRFQFSSRRGVGKESCRSNHKRCWQHPDQRR